MRASLTATEPRRCHGPAHMAMALTSSTRHSCRSMVAASPWTSCGGGGHSDGIVFSQRAEGCEQIQSTMVMAHSSPWLAVTRHDVPDAMAMLNLL
ncbi:hypothetical protein BDA96_05G121400 [Sorghum bicolor]|uniref:Uncharacterized protein n=2 Tax=Sorghum bicolor TaxID=4558 RepID=A0A921QX89_SORBI|nr:hypothetical protein BDA96_05G121400 [Sorghum bicolor]OQU83410.1 hypothetical protein SORBI_3005G110559 [Sorghum bicolor]